ncbi:MAG: right-handed parallel beta-helix repeat-containing protein, partial [Candidatus Nanohaloarchaea archaeon]
MLARNHLKAFILVIFALTLISGVSSAKQISGCQVIDSPGTYKLLGDIDVGSGDNCFKIRTSNVTLKGQGNVLNMEGTSATGIQIFNDTSLQNISVKNIEIKSGQQGIWAEKIEGLSIDSVKIKNASNFGIEVSSASSVKVEDSKFIGNGKNGAYFYDVGFEKFSNITATGNTGGVEGYSELSFDKLRNKLKAYNVQVGEGKVVNFSTSSSLSIGGVEASAPDGLGVVKSVYLESFSGSYTLNLSYSDSQLPDINDVEDSIVLGKTDTPEEKTLTLPVDSSKFSVNKSSNKVVLKNTEIYGNRLGIMASTGRPHADFMHFAEYLPGNPQIYTAGKNSYYECDNTNFDGNYYSRRELSWDYNGGLANCTWTFPNGETKSYDPNGTRKYVRYKFTEPGLKTVNLTV